MVDRLQAVFVAEDDERRAVERALHDGVQQQLIAVAVNLQRARMIRERDPDGADELLDEVRSDVGRALEDVRELALRVHPPLLDAHGIDAAVRMAAAAAPLPTDVEGTIGVEPPPAVAVSVYRCCACALAAAEGSRATVRLAAAGGVVELELLVEDGRVEPGALDSLFDRVEAFGGMLDVALQRVELRIPFAS